MNRPSLEGRGDLAWQQLLAALELQPQQTAAADSLSAEAVDESVESATAALPDMLRSLLQPSVELERAMNEHLIVAVTDRGGRIVHANQRFCDISGYRLDELLGQDHRILNSGLHSRDFFRQMWRSIGRGQTWHGEFRNRAKDGSYYWVQSTIVPLLDAHGKPFRFISFRTEITRLKALETELRANEQRFRLIFERSPDAQLLLDPAMGRFIDCNSASAVMLHCASEKEAILLRPEELSPPLQPDGRASSEKAQDMIATAVRLGSHRFEWIHLSPWREPFPVEVTLTPIQVEGRQLLTTVWRDLTERKRAERWQSHYARTLAQIAAQRPLQQVLQTLAEFVELQGEELLCCILLRSADGYRLRTAAAPSLPDFFCRALDGIAIGEGQGCCGTAAALGQAVIVECIDGHPHWSGLREVAGQASLQACWSVPIMSAGNTVLGTLAIYHRDARGPRSDELELIERSASLAAIAIERSQHSQEQRLAQVVFAQSAEAILVTDARNRILLVNRAFEEMSGYTAQQVVGQDAGMLASERNDASQLAEIGAALERDERWQGELWNRRSNGETHPVLASLANVRDESGGLSQRIHIFADISAQKRQAARIEQLAFYDPLTGLPNRSLLSERLERALDSARRRGQQLALLFMDLDRFKDINDSLGHAAGDEALVLVAQRLGAVIAAGQMLARMGGDEFVLLLEDCNHERAAQAAATLQAALQPPLRVREREFSLTLSLGVALFPDDADGPDELLKQTDIAMYRAKSSGGGCCFYRADMGDELGRRLQVAARLRLALKDGRLALHYQPMISLDEGRLAGAEALLRWHDEVLGDVTPGEFIPVAEARGMMAELGEWVLDEACRQLVEWRQQGNPLPLRLAINFAPQQLQQAHIAEVTRGRVLAAGAAPEWIEFELTESSMVADPHQAIRVMNELAEAGFSLAIDDFGTGYSSLKYLKDFAAGTLKIDMSFVHDMLTDSNDRAIVGAIIAMARSLDMRTIAEGIELAEQARVLTEMGCNLAQGFHFGRPQPALEFAQRWLR